MEGRKIVFLDIDGTFTVPLEKPTPLAIEAVRKDIFRDWKVGENQEGTFCFSNICRCVDN